MKRLILSLTSTFFAFFTTYNHSAIAQFNGNKTLDVNQTSFFINSPQLLSFNNSYEMEKPELLKNSKNFSKARINSLNRIRRRTYVNNYSIKKPSYFNRSLSYQTQETSVINLDYYNLKQPHNLVISSHARLNGEISLNGRVIKTIRGNRVAINLSNCLSRGRNTLEIEGNYRPVSSSVQVEFSAPGMVVSQSTGGSGTIAQTLIIDVR
ncbi:MAG TPA: hypothetical protein V6D28_28410 [Leptolyngbyaceae cyanobacterium]